MQEVKRNTYLYDCEPECEVEIVEAAWCVTHGRYLSECTRRESASRCEQTVTEDYQGKDT